MSMHKVGRNDPCPCGSGRKYRKCHLEFDEFRSDLPAALQAVAMGPVHGRPKIDALWKGHRVRAVGNRLYVRPPHETFHEFVIDVLRLTLGEEWYTGEAAKVPDDRHELVHWFFVYRDFTKRMSTDEHRLGDRLWESDPTGLVQALVTLAYDVYQLQHTKGGLPEALLNRLKNRQGFQGARYEIAVAATFARMTWTIEWIEDKSVKHCEFIARDPSGTLSVGVEAKSRHRAGVLHQPGDIDLEKVARADVDRLFREALAQAPQAIPFIVFVDLNVPPRGGLLLETPVVDELRRMVDAYGTPSPSTPDPYTALVLTSYPWHYAVDEAKASRGQHIMVIPKYARHPLPLEILEHLRRALSEYGRVPPENAER